MNNEEIEKEIQDIKKQISELQTKLDNEISIRTYLIDNLLRKLRKICFKK